MDFALQNAKQIAREREVPRYRDALSTSVDGTAAAELATLLSLEKEPERIECFDISHLQGEAAVGSRVVFLHGRPQTDLYRRFNVKTVQDTRDDYANIEEVLARRFRRARSSGSFRLVGKEDPWSIPDVVVVDGGRGQLSAALRGMAKAGVFPSSIVSKFGDSDKFVVEEINPSTSSSETNLSPIFVPVVALAKREEKVFKPNSKDSINQNPDSPGMLLLRALCDESHRFAVSSHKKLRSKINSIINYVQSIMKW